MNKIHSPETKKKQLITAKTYYVITIITKED